MRFDSVGMFWEDLPTKAGRSEIVRTMPPIPETGWTPPAEFPNLAAAEALSIDVETWDPELNEAGPGWARGVGHIVGVSIAAPGTRGWYFPIRHEVEREHNLDPAKVLSWLRELLADRRPKIGANLLYDVGWLKQEGVDVGGRWYDIQNAEALLNSEAPSVALESLAQQYLGQGKETSLLYQWCADFYGGPNTDRQRKNIYRAPPRLVGPYAEADATLPLAIIGRQWGALAERGLLSLFDLETRLMPMLLAMRFKGVRVDIDYAERQRDRFSAIIDEAAANMRRIVGFEVNPSAAATIQRAFDALGLTYRKTASGNASFTADFLEGVNHPLAEEILRWRRATKLKATFLESYILDKHVNGRVYCQFHQLKGDENGTRSGRLSSSDPNLQNIPVRSEEGKLIRGAFTASPGGRWRKYDYSQIEYRLLAHHAVGEGANDIRARYNRDPHTDYHEATQGMIAELTGLELQRRATKTINFGLIYGMSQRELARRLGLDAGEGSRLFAAYHRAVPFAKATAKACSQAAEQEGFITTLLGRRSEFPLWVPADYRRSFDAKPLPFAEALLEYGKISRAFTHKALNRRLQGGAADIIKAAMVSIYESGVLAETGVPSLTVHDELDFDDEGDPGAPCWRELRNLLENAVSCLVPIVVDESIGPNWGDAD